MSLIADLRSERRPVPRPGSATPRRLGVLALIAALAAPPALAEPVVEVKGSFTIGAKLMPALVEGFVASQKLSFLREPGAEAEREERLRALFGIDPVFSVDLQRRGSTTGFQALMNDTAQIGMADRPISEDEVKALAALGADMRHSTSEHVIGLDGIALIVSPRNKLAAISLFEVAQIFSGQITDWRQLGLSPGRITVHAPDQNSGTFSVFNNLVLKQYEAEIAPEALRYNSNEKIVAAVTADPYAIGVAPFAFVESARMLPVILECGIVAAPDRFAVQAEEYPLTRRLYLYSKGAPRLKEAAALLEFARSDAAQPIISKTGFVNQSLLVQDPAAYSDRLINAMQMAAPAEERQAVGRFAQVSQSARRLSATLRFARGGDLLDAKAVTDAGRVARWLELPENANKKLILMGFSDSIGGYQANIPLSQARAEAARRALLIQVDPRFDAKRISMEAFGPVAPIACDETARGRATNRRVEIWVTE